MDGQNHNIDVNKLTTEAEAGQGHYVRSILDQMPFEEQVHIAREIAHLSKEHNNLAGYPKIEFFIQNCCGDADSENGYINIKLYRRTPRGDLGPFFTKEELLYQNSLNLTTGKQKATDSDL
jgi:hypothetical protein